MIRTGGPGHPVGGMAGSRQAVAGSSHEAGARVDERVYAAVKEHYPLAWRLVRRLGIPEADAEDAVQRVFLVVSRRITEVETGSERSFVASTAVRVASEIRRGTRRKPVELRAELDEASDPTEAPDELVESYRARRLLDSLLDRMPEDVRSVFVLFEIEELTLTEIAAALAIPRGTVASRLARARTWFAAEVALQVASRKEDP